MVASGRKWSIVYKHFFENILRQKILFFTDHFGRR